MSRKRFPIVVVVLLVASCAFGQLTQGWSDVVTNSATLSGGMGLAVSGNLITQDLTQTSLGWSGTALQSSSSGYGQLAVAGGIGSSQGVGQIVSGSGGQTIDLTGMSQGLTLTAGQSLGTTSGWLGVSHGTQAATASQTQMVGSWSGLSTQSQSASILQSGTVISTHGGSGSVYQSAYSSSYQSQN